MINVTTTAESIQPKDFQISEAHIIRRTAKKRNPLKDNGKMIISIWKRFQSKEEMRETIVHSYRANIQNKYIYISTDITLNGLLK